MTRWFNRFNPKCYLNLFRNPIIKTMPDSNKSEATIKTFGNRSEEKIATCHPDLQLIFEESLKVSMVDFGVSEGHRSTEKQKEYFDRGLSKIDGINKKGKHNFMPSMAGDVYAYVKGKPKLAYNKTYLVYLMGVITATAERLLNEGRISHKIRSGYNWDGDGEIGTDQRFQDLPHYELI